jgi:hypothetical protein
MNRAPAEGWLVRDAIPEADVTGRLGRTML